MKKILNKINKAVQVVLLAPIKLPSKALNIVKYIALGLGILDSMMAREEGAPDGDTELPEEKGVKDEDTK